MFNFFKKRSAIPSAQELNRLTAAACEDVKTKWIYFNQTFHLSTEIPLPQKINFFCQPIQEFFQNKYPVLLQGPAEIFWLTVFTAILESKTHAKEEVNAAIEELRCSYVKAESD